MKIKPGNIFLYSWKVGRSQRHNTWLVLKEQACDDWEIVCISSNVGNKGQYHSISGYALKTAYEKLV